MYFKKIARGAAIAVASFITILQSCYPAHESCSSPSLAINAARDPEFIDNVLISGSASKSLEIKTAKPEHSVGYNPANATAMQTKYAGILGVLPQSVTNVALYSLIDAWYGVRYRLGGTDQHGIDCSAFMQRIFADVYCINLLRTAQEQFNTCKMLWDKAKLKEGDLVFFRIRSSRISHVGLYLMNNFFVHASSSKGVMISNLDEVYWNRYYAGAGRLPGVL